MQSQATNIEGAGNAFNQSATFNGSALTTRDLTGDALVFAKQTFSYQIAKSLFHDCEDAIMNDEIELNFSVIQKR